MRGSPKNLLPYLGWLYRISIGILKNIHGGKFAAVGWPACYDISMNFSSAS